MAGSLFVLGATGQIGRCLVARLARAGRPALCLARRPPAGSGWAAVDLAAVPPGMPALPEAGIATVPIWLLPPVLPALAEAGARRLVVFSTTSIMGKAATRSRRERRQVDAVLAAERSIAGQAAALGLKVSILRPTLIYGAGRDANVSAAARFIRRFGFYPLSGAAAGLRQPVHADDLAAAALAVLDRPDLAGQAFNLGGGETLEYREMIGRIFDALGRPRRLVRVPCLPWLAALYGRLAGLSTLTPDAVRRMNLDLAFDDGAAARAFGYAPRGFRPDFGPGSPLEPFQ